MPEPNSTCAIKNKGKRLKSRYIRIITDLAQTCKYGALENELIRDRLVVGIRDSKLSENLQLDESLTLEKAIEKITQAERVKSQNTEIRENDTLHIDRAKVPNKSGFKNFKKNNYLKKCFRCGDKKAHQRKD